jgi:hypothetical protein
MDHAQIDTPARTSPAQGEMFAPAEMRKGWQPPKIDPEDVRRRLHAMLDAITAATDELPWSMEKARYNRTVFPQMARWLPLDEAEALRARFRTELQRFGL